MRTGMNNGILGLRAVLTLFFTFGVCGFALADQFCSDIARAVGEGKSDFVQVKGPRSRDSDATSVWYTTTLSISGFPTGEDGCQIDPNEDRPNKLSMSCTTKKITDGSAARQLFERLSQQLGECMKTQFSSTGRASVSTYDGGPALEFTGLGETAARWNLRARLRMSIFTSKRHPEYPTDYHISLTIGPE